MVIFVRHVEVSCLRKNCKMGQQFWCEVQNLFCDSDPDLSKFFLDFANIWNSLKIIGVFPTRISIIAKQGKDFVILARSKQVFYIKLFFYGYWIPWNTSDSEGTCAWPVSREDLYLAMIWQIRKTIWRSILGSKNLLNGSKIERKKQVAVSQWNFKMTLVIVNELVKLLKCC